MNIELTGDEIEDIREPLLYHTRAIFNKMKRAKTEADKEHFKRNFEHYRPLIKKLYEAAEKAHYEESKLT